MKISEAIKSLTDLLAELGDWELVTLHEVDGEGFYIEREATFEPIELPACGDCGGENEMVISLMNDSDHVELQSPQRRLKLVKED